MRRSRLRPTALLCLLLFLLSACGGEGQPPEPPPQMATIRVATFWSDGSLDALVAGFYAKYAYYRIEKVLPPPNMTNPVEFILEKIREGAVDVVQVDQYWPELMQARALEPLSNFYNKSALDQQAFGGLIEQMRQVGTIYDIPYALQPELLVYDVEHFKAAGVTPPVRPWTWEEFREAAQLLTRGEGKERVWGVAGEATERLAMLQLAERTRGNSLQATEEQMRTSLLFVRSMIIADRSVPKAQARDWEKGGFYISPQDFREGRAAITTTTLGDYLSTQAFVGREWGILPRPTLDGSNRVYVTPRTFGIPGNSPQQHLAWRFIEFAAGPEGAAVLAANGTLPAYKTPAAQEAWMGRKPAPHPSTALLFETEWQVSGRTLDPTIRKLFRPTTKAVSDGLALVKPLESVLAEYRREVKEIREESP